MSSEPSVVDGKGRLPTRSICINNVPRGTLGALIRDKFSVYGPIQSISPNPFTKAVRGHAFVNFKHTKSAIAAVQRAHKTPVFLEDEWVFVYFAKPPDEVEPKSAPEIESNAAQAMSEEYIPTGPRAMAPRRVQPETLATPVSPPRERRAPLHSTFDSRRLFDSYRPPPRPSQNPEHTHRQVSMDHPLRDAETHRNRYTPSIQNQTGIAKASSSARGKTDLELRDEYLEKLQIEKIQAKNREIDELKAKNLRLEKERDEARLLNAKNERLRWERDEEILNATNSAEALETTGLQNLKNSESTSNTFIWKPPVSISNAQPSVGALSAKHSQSPPLRGLHHPIRERRSGTEDNASITSASTRMSIRKTQCADCKEPESSLRPYTLCATCDRRYHASCGSPSPSAPREESGFVCGRCKRAGRTPTSVLASRTARDLGDKGSTTRPVDLKAAPPLNLSNNDGRKYAKQVSLKHITCAFWRRGHCRHPERECNHTHADTGVYSTFGAVSPSARPPSVNMSPSSPVETQQLRYGTDTPYSPQPTLHSPVEGQQLRYGTDTPYSPQPTLDSDGSYSPKPATPLIEPIESTDRRRPTQSPDWSKDLVKNTFSSTVVTSTTVTRKALPPTPRVEDAVAVAPIRHRARPTGGPRMRRLKQTARKATASIQNESNIANRTEMSPMSTTDHSKIAETRVKLCNACGKKLFSSVDLCTACQEQREGPLHVEAQMPTPAESPLVIDGDERDLETPSLQETTTEATEAFSPPLPQAGSEYRTEAFAGTKRPPADNIFITKKRQKVGLHIRTDLALSRDSVRLNDSSNIPKTLEQLTEDLRRKNRSTRRQSAPEPSRLSEQGQTRPSGKENLHSTISPLSMIRPPIRMPSKENSPPTISPLSEDIERFANGVNAPRNIGRSPASETLQNPPQVADSSSERAQPQRPKDLTVLSRPITRVQSTRKRCKSCYEKHTRCFHHPDGKWDRELCRLYLEENAGITPQALTISATLYRQVVRAAGLPSTLVERYEEECSDPNDGIIDDFSASDHSSEKNYSDLDEGSGDEGMELPGLQDEATTDDATVIDNDEIMTEEGDEEDDNLPLANARSKEWGSLASSGLLAETNKSPSPTATSAPEGIRQLQERGLSTLARTSEIVSRSDPIQSSPKIVLRLTSTKFRSQDPSIKEATTIKEFRDNTFDRPDRKADWSQIDDDSDEDSDEEMTNTSNLITTFTQQPRHDRVGLDFPGFVHKVATRAHPNPIAHSQPRFHVPGQPPPSRKQVWKKLISYQCQERREKFGNPHQLVTSLPDRTVKATVQVSVPDSGGMPGRASSFHVNPIERRKVEMPLGEFLGAPKEPVVERDGADLVFVERSQNRERREYGLRRFAGGVEKFPFIKG